METLRVAQLREGLRAKNLPMGGNKSELYQRLRESLGKEGRSVQDFLRELEVRQDSGINQDHEAGEDIGLITDEPQKASCTEQEEHLNMGDSASVISRQSVASGGSRQSSVSSSGSRRALAAVTRARLEAKLQKLDELQAIEREEERLK